MLAQLNARRLCFATLLTTVPFLVSAASAEEETIVVRRGKQVHDVTISDDVEAQEKLWSGIRDKTHKAIMEHVETGEGYYREYALNFLWRYRPESIHQSLVAAFDEAANDPAIRARAAQPLIYLGDFRGVDWAMEEIEKAETPEQWDQLRSLFNRWFPFEKSQGTEPRRFQLTAGVQRYLKDAFTERNYDSHIVPWIERLDGKGVQKVLRELIERDEYSGRSLKLVKAYRNRFPQDEWGFETLCQSVRNGGSTGGLQEFCLDQSSPLHEQAIAALQESILASKSPAYVCAAAISSGIAFPDPFLQQVRDQFKAKAAAAEDPRKEWDNLDTCYLASLFQGTADEQALEVLRDLPDQVQLILPPPSADQLLKIKMVSGKPMDEASIQALGEAKMPLERMEAVFRVKNKSMDDVFSMFHQHGFAKDLTPKEVQRRLSLKSRDGKASRYLPMPVGQFSKYEIIRETFREQGRWANVYYGSSIGNFWKLVDQTDGEFNPQFFTQTADPTDPKGRRSVIGFVWRGKRYRYPKSLHIESLNVILKREGSPNSFAQFSAFPSGGFLAEGTYKLGFAPTKVWDALESDFGFGIRSR